MSGMVGDVIDINRELSFLLDKEKDLSWAQ